MTNYMKTLLSGLKTFIDKKASPNWDATEKEDGFIKNKPFSSTYTTNHYTEYPVAIDGFYYYTVFLSEDATQTDISNWVANGLDIILNEEAYHLAQAQGASDGLFVYPADTAPENADIVVAFDEFSYFYLDTTFIVDSISFEKPIYTKMTDGIKGICYSNEIGLNSTPSAVNIKLDDKTYNLNKIRNATVIGEQHKLFTDNEGVLLFDIRLGDNLSGSITCLIPFNHMEIIADGVSIYDYYWDNTSLYYKDFDNTQLPLPSTEQTFSDFIESLPDTINFKFNPSAESMTLYKNFDIEDGLIIYANRQDLTIDDMYDIYDGENLNIPVTGIVLFIDGNNSIYSAFSNKCQSNNAFIYCSIDYSITTETIKKIDKKYIPVVDTVVDDYIDFDNMSSTNPVQNKVIAENLDDMWAEIDNKAQYNAVVRNITYNTTSKDFRKVIGNADTSIVTLATLFTNPNFTGTATIANKEIATKEYVDQHATNFISKPLTINSTAWSNNKATISDSDIKLNSVIFISPSPTYITVYNSAGIYCSAQGDGSIEFTCTATPSGDVAINVLIL